QPDQICTLGALLIRRRGLVPEVAAHVGAVGAVVGANTGAGVAGVSHRFLLEVVEGWAGRPKRPRRGCRSGPKNRRKSRKNSFEFFRRSGHRVLRPTTVTAASGSRATSALATGIAIVPRVRRAAAHAGNAVKAQVASATEPPAPRKSALNCGDFLDTSAPSGDTSRESEGS